MHSGRNARTISWPDGYRKCRKCSQLKSFNEFHKHKQGFCGYYHICKECRKPIEKAQWASVDIRVKILARAKSRAIRKNRKFNLTIDDIIIPENCPVFGIPMDIPSIDRIDSSKDYTKDNVRIISNRANILKSNATIAELELVLADLKRIT